MIVHRGKKVAFYSTLPYLLGWRGIQMYQAPPFIPIFVQGILGGPAEFRRRFEGPILAGREPGASPEVWGGIKPKHDEVTVDDERCHEVPLNRMGARASPEV
eukprot:1161178-Pelagomonas_calceolata.AAC.6